MQEDAKLWERRLTLTAGFFLIALGIIFNQWTIAHFFTFDGSLAFGSAVFVWFFDGVFIVGGGVILYYRSRIAEHITFSKRNVLAFVVIGVVMLGGLEVAARMLDASHGGDIAVERDKGGKDIIPFRVFGPTFYQYEGDTLYITSRHDEKYPFHKEDNTVRVVAFGGSTTQQSIDGKHYPLLLQERLNERYPDKTIEVINVANSGYATSHSLITLLLNVSSWDPDIIILSHNINDLKASYFPDLTPNYANKYSHPFYTKPDKSRNCSFCKLYNWSTLYWLLEQQMQAYSFRQGLGEDFYRRKSYGVEPPQMAQDVFRRNLKSFVVNARLTGADVILGTQPLQPSFEYFDRGSRWKPYSDIVNYPLHEEYVSHHARFNEIIREVAYSYPRVYLVENDRDFNGDKEYFIDNVHYTMEGLQKLTNNYLQTFINKRLIR